MAAETSKTEIAALLAVLEIVSGVVQSVSVIRAVKTLATATVAISQ